MSAKQTKITTYNIQGRESINPNTNKKFSKVRALTQFLCQYNPQRSSWHYKQDAIALQETRGEVAWEYIKEQVHMANPNAKVFDCPNIDNPNKGGVSTIFFDPSIEVEKVMDDNMIPTTWLDIVPPLLKPQVQNLFGDAVKGRILLVKFKWNGEWIHLLNTYAPCGSDKPSQNARYYFFKFIDDNIDRYDKFIHLGDHNNLPNPDTDRITKDGIPLAQNDREDMESFDEYISSRLLNDTYMSNRNEFSGPIMMTNKSSTGKTYTRIDRSYHSPSLDDYLFIDSSTSFSRQNQCLRKHTSFDVKILLTSKIF